MFWYEIPGFSGYRINHAGDVLSMKYSEPRVMKSWVSEGYRRISLRKDGKYHQFKIGALLLMTFVGPCPEGMELCHNDGHSLNDALSNLRWDTSSENNYDQVLHGTHFEAARTHCDQGHEFTPENTMRRKTRKGKTVRKCKECHRLSMARYRARKKAGLIPPKGAQSSSSG